MNTSGASVHIVVGFDFSPLAELAMREAAALAVDRPDIAIHLVNARSDDGRFRISHSSNENVAFEVEEAMTESMRTALRDQGAEEGVEVFTHALVGDAANIIVAMAEDVDPIERLLPLHPDGAFSDVGAHVGYAANRIVHVG